MNDKTWEVIIFAIGASLIGVSIKSHFGFSSTDAAMFSVGIYFLFNGVKV